MLRRPIEFTLHAAVAVMNQTVRVWSRPEGLFEGVERDVCSQRVHDPPADDLSGEHVNDKGDVDEAPPRRHVGEIRNPKFVRAGRAEIAID